MHKSTMNQKWKLYQSGFMLGLFLCGSVFMMISLMMPIMPEEVYGAAITVVPAELWSFSVVFASTMSLYGIYKNGRSRWSPLWRVAGYTLHLLIFSAIAVMATSTVFGMYMAIYAMFFFSTHMAFFIWVNLRDVCNVFRV